MTRTREGHSLTELRQHYEQAVLEHPTTARCMWCQWEFHGPAAAAMDAARAHRTAVHQVNTPHRRKRPPTRPILPGDLDTHIANARAQGAAAWTRADDD